MDHRKEALFTDVEEDPEAAEHAATLHTLAPEPEDLDQDPALVVLIGGTVTGHDILERYPSEWVVSLEDPEIPGIAAELGSDVGETPMTARLRERLPVVVVPHPNTLGAETSFARVALMAMAATYRMSAYAVLTDPVGATDQEYRAYPAPATLAMEGWLSY